MTKDKILIFIIPLFVFFLIVCYFCFLGISYCLASDVEFISNTDTYTYTWKWGQPCRALKTELDLSDYDNISKISVKLYNKYSVNIETSLCLSSINVTSNSSWDSGNCESEIVTLNASPYLDQYYDFVFSSPYSTTGDTYYVYLWRTTYAGNNLAVWLDPSPDPLTPITYFLTVPNNFTSCSVSWYETCTTDYVCAYGYPSSYVMNMLVYYDDTPSSTTTSITLPHYLISPSLLPVLAFICFLVVIFFFIIYTLTR